jgi:hypothetical protein
VAQVADLGAAHAALKAESQALRDEVARLNGLPPRPPSRPSGMEQATGGVGPGTGGNKRSRRRRGAKRDREAVTTEVVVKAAPPPGSWFKGYQDLLVRELTLTPAVVRYRRERWATPPGRRCWRRCRPASSAASGPGCGASSSSRMPRAR